MTWALVVWCTLIGVWVISAGGKANSTAHDYCVAHETGLTLKVCEEAHHAGTGLAVLAILGFGFFGFVVLSLIWIMSRPKPEVLVAREPLSFSDRRAEPMDYLPPDPGEAA
jgi:hypothetical protein